MNIKPALLILIALGLPKHLHAQVPTTALSVEDRVFEGYFKNKANHAFVNGKLFNASKEDISKLQVAYTVVVPLTKFQVKKISTIGPDGTFQLDMDYSFPYQQIWLSLGSYFYTGIYVNQGLTIELDFTKLKQSPVEFYGDGVTFKGIDSALNTFLNKYILFQREEQLKLDQEGQALSFGMQLNTVEFTTKMNQHYSKVEILENKFLNENPSPYGWILENERLSRRYGQVCIHYWGKQMEDSLWQKVRKHKSFLMSNDGALFYDYQFNYVTSEPPNLRAPDWTGLSGQPGLTSDDRILLNWIVRENEKKVQGLAYDTATLGNLSTKAYSLFTLQLQLMVARKLAERLDKEFTPSKADLLKLKLTGDDPIIQKPIMEYLMATMRTEWTKEVVAVQYKATVETVNRINSLLANSKSFTSDHTLGKPILETPFGAKLYQVDSISAADLLVRLKKSFPNKAIVIDLWATWCGPCISEMPHALELYKDTDHLPVEFVFLCTTNGSTIQKWKNSIARFEQPGTHIYLNDKIANELMAKFSLTGYPGHIFINPAGNYIPNALKGFSHMPSSELETLIRQQ